MEYTVTVVTGTRAEYGLLRGVLLRLYESGTLHTRLVVTGAHLSQAQGYTVQEIEADGFAIDARLDFLSRPAPAGRLGTAKRTADALGMFVDYFAANPTDAVLLLGDRYEILAAALAASMLGTPVAHISGGDVTYGADDDWYRHSISKMAKLHFPSCEAYRQRLLRMGEAPETVFNVGGLGDENIRSLPLLPRAELAQSLGLALEGPYALVTFHPETATDVEPEAQVAALVEAMKQHTELFFLMTQANADAGGELVNAALRQFAAAHQHAALFSSLGVQRYLSAMQHAAVVLGNSSSGVVETPTFGVPAVDIGARQQGRVTGENVIHCAADAMSISVAIDKALDPAFRERARSTVSPYNGGDTANHIVGILEQKLAEGSLTAPKAFYDGEAKA